MANQFGEISLRNSCLAFIKLNFNFPQRVRSLIGKSSAYYARGIVVPTRRRNMSHSSLSLSLVSQSIFLKDTFGDRLISRFGLVNWPPRSCDLTPLDYFLWGYVKSLVYADKPQTLDHLEDNIRRVIADIRPQMLEKVIENWTSRLDYIRASRGSPMPEIIFKM
ncbi:putative LOC100569746 [Trichonephila clavipes]|nr:putative LOC100569746 [Trichonephila clavipes]